jgi:hypothetical protein
MPPVTPNPKNVKDPSRVKPEKKVVVPRKKKLSLEFSEPSLSFTELRLGVINEDKAYTYKVESPVFITGYSVKDLDNLRRTITAHYAESPNTTFWCADYSREMNEFGLKDLTKVFTEVKRDKEEIRNLLETVLLLASKNTHGNKVLFVTDAFKLFEGDPELGELLVKVVELSKSQENFHVYLQTHGNRIERGENEIQTKLLHLMETKLLAGNIFSSEIKFIFGEENVVKITHLDKNEVALYPVSLKPVKFVAYHTPNAWFKKFE